MFRCLRHSRCLASCPDCTAALRARHFRPVADRPGGAEVFIPVQGGPGAAEILAVSA